MEGEYSGSDLEGLAANFRDAVREDKRKKIIKAGAAMADMLQDLPANTTALYSDATHYVMARGWGMTALSTERAMAHVNMCPASINEPEIEFLAPAEEKKDAAEYWIPSILADLFALADEHQLDIITLIAKAQEQREN